MQRTDAGAILAQFFLEVAARGWAFGLSCCGDICAVHGHGQMCLPLWSDEDVARRLQRRYWPKLVVTRIALGEVRERCLPKAQQDGVPIGIGVAVSEHTVAVPAQLVDLGLREAEQYLREKAAR